MFYIVLFFAQPDNKDIWNSQKNSSYDKCLIFLMNPLDLIYMKTRLTEYDVFCHCTQVFLMRRG